MGVLSERGRTGRGAERGLDGVTATARNAAGGNALPQTTCHHPQDWPAMARTHENPVNSMGCARDVGWEGAPQARQRPDSLPPGLPNRLPTAIHCSPHGIDQRPVGETGAPSVILSVRGFLPCPVSPRRPPNWCPFWRA